MAKGVLKINKCTAHLLIFNEKLNRRGMEYKSMKDLIQYSRNVLSRGAENVVVSIF